MNYSLKTPILQLAIVPSSFADGGWLRMHVQLLCPLRCLADQGKQAVASGSLGLAIYTTHALGLCSCKSLGLYSAYSAPHPLADTTAAPSMAEKQLLACS